MYLNLITVHINQVQVRLFEFDTTMTQSLLQVVTIES